MTARVRIDETDPTPPYEQLRRQLAALMGSGALTEGERLPSVRQLAADLGLASGTVARSYRELEQAGLVETRRGAGTRVARTGKALTDSGLRRRIEESVEEVVGRLRLLGADDESIRRAVSDVLDRPGRPVAPTGP